MRVIFFFLSFFFFFFCYFVCDPLHDEARRSGGRIRERNRNVARRCVEQQLSECQETGHRAADGLESVCSRTIESSGSDAATGRPRKSSARVSAQHICKEIRIDTPVSEFQQTGHAANISELFLFSPPPATPYSEVREILDRCTFL